MAQPDRLDERGIPSKEPIPAIPHVAFLSQRRRDTVSLHEIFNRPYRRWLFVLASTLLTFGLAVWYPVFATPLHTIEMEIFPRTPSGFDRIAGVSSRLSALAGFGVSGSGNASFQRHEKMLTSRQVETRFARDHHVLQLIFAERWDSARNDWKPQLGMTARLHIAAASLLGRTDASAPDIEDLREFLMKRLQIEVPSTSVIIGRPVITRPLEIANTQSEIWT